MRDFQAPSRLYRELTYTFINASYLDSKNYNSSTEVKKSKQDEYEMSGLKIRVY